MSPQHTSSGSRVGVVVSSSVVSHRDYQAIPTVMERSDIAATLPDADAGVGSSSDSADREDINVAGVGLPSTLSTQRLMPASDTESVELSTSDGRYQAGADGVGGGGGVGFLSPLQAGMLRLGDFSPNGSKWFTVGVLCFVNLINYMDRFTVAGVLAFIQDDFNVKDDKAGLLQTVFIFAYMIFAPVFGYLGDRYSRRWNMALAVLLWSCCTLVGSYMQHFGWFIAFRALVGIGEASYSTIAPTIISDLFVGEMRSKMLAVFYFAIPVGSGLGYIVGSEMADLTNNWRYALRVTPVLGLIAVVLLTLIKDPKRGESEGIQHAETTTYKEDLSELVKNRSYMLTTLAFTCVSFVAGALAWWAPKFIYLGMRMQPGNEELTLNDVAFKFGAITMTAGIIGVPLGSFIAQSLAKRVHNADPLVCAFGLLLSAPLLTGAIIAVSRYTIATYVLVFFGQVALNLNWAIVADMLLYVVVPARRGTAEAFQILIAHAFGDAGSPYLIGLISEYMKSYFRLAQVAEHNLANSGNGMQVLSLTLGTITATTTTEMVPLQSGSFVQEDSNLNIFKALQYALFTTSFVEVLGGALFLWAAPYIIQDRNNAANAAMAPLPSTLNMPAQRFAINID